MFFVGIDPHQKTITVGVVNQERAVVTCRNRFQAVVEATASYKWPSP